MGDTSKKILADLAMSAAMVIGLLLILNYFNGGGVFWMPYKMRIKDGENINLKGGSAYEKKIYKKDGSV